MSKKLLIILLLSTLLLAVALLLALSPIGKFLRYFISWENSAEIESKASFDNNFELIMETNKKGSKVKSASISILDNKTKNVVYSCEEQYRVIDFGGAFWGKGCYDFWIVSGDIGTYCYHYDNASWKKGYLLLADQTVDGKIVISFENQKREFSYLEVPEAVLSVLKL